MTQPSTSISTPRDLTQPKATVNRILLGTYDVRISTLRKIAQGLGIPMGELLDIQEKKTHKKDSSFHTKGAKKKSGIVLKILVPKDEDIPKWLVDACREGVGQIENVPAKRRPKTTGSSKQRQVGLDEILGR